MFLVELIASSFLDLISKQARLSDAVSAFLFSLKRLNATTWLRSLLSKVFRFPGLSFPPVLGEI